jgi:hypothetical protein
MGTKDRKSNHGLAASELSRWRVRAINAFLIFHLIAIACWCAPSHALPFELVRAVVGPYFRFAGLFQTWDMFSPSPKRRNSYLEAMVVFSDGYSEYWTFPRVERMGYGERYAKERYRKFEEKLVEDQYADLWPDAARYVAREFRGGNRKPEIVMLILNWSDLVQNPDGSFSDLPWQSDTFYHYRVEPEDLE